MLKFITALLFAQALLAAPVPEDADKSTYPMITYIQGPTKWENWAIDRIHGNMNGDLNVPRTLEKCARGSMEACSASHDLDDQGHINPGNLPQHVPTPFKR